MQGKARQGRAGQGKARQGRARQRQHKTTQDKTPHKTRENTRQDKATTAQDKPNQAKTRCRCSTDTIILSWIHYVPVPVSASVLYDYMRIDSIGDLKIWLFYFDPKTKEQSPVRWWYHRELLRGGRMFDLDRFVHHGSRATASKITIQRYTPIKIRITGKKPINIILTFFRYYGSLILGFYRLWFL